MSEHEYWSEYYKKQVVKKEPSLFAQFIQTHFKDSISTILEVGSGDGRDAYYLGEKYKVMALDIANKPENTENCTFQKKSMASLSGSYDLLYSRFSLHSISEEIEDYVLQYALHYCGSIAFEVRSVKDELASDRNKQNESRAATSYASAHYRRFFDLENIKQKMQRIGFEVTLAEESNEFAPYKDQNPYCIRIIAHKK